MTDSLIGNLLVASSLVDDPIYAGGVCLLVQQDDTNVIGVMLNRPMKPNPDALLAMLGDSPGSAQKTEASQSSKNRLPPYDASLTEPVENESSGVESATGDAKNKGLADANSGELSPWRMLHFGGPLSGPVVAIHQSSQHAEAETGSGIYVAAQKQHLEDLMRGQSAPYRIIVGHLGWESGQLAAEIDSGFWHVVPATVDSVFSSAGEMWPRLIRRATSNSLAKWIGVKDLVGAAELN